MINKCERCGERLGDYFGIVGHNCGLLRQPQPLPTSDQCALDYIAIGLRPALDIPDCSYYSVTDPRTQDIIARLKAIELEIEQLTGISAADYEDVF